MNTICRLCIAALLVIACQACSTAGSTSANANGSTAGVATPAQPQRISSGQQNLQADGSKDMVPAVVGLPPEPGPSGTYRIGAHDLLKIEVFQVEELSSEERVNEEGFIVIPLIDAVQVGGLTPKEAEERLAEILGQDYLQDPQVNVFVSEYANQNVTVSGAVKKPGVFPLKGRTTLLQAIAQAEGVTEVANEDQIIIFRARNGAGAQAYVVNLEAISEGRLADPTLIGDDRVIIPESGTAVFFKGVTDTLRGFVHVPVY